MDSARLRDRLEAGLHSHLCLVSARARFGKATVLAGWLDQSSANGCRRHKYHVLHDALNSSHNVTSRTPVLRIVQTRQKR